MQLFIEQAASPLSYLKSEKYPEFQEGNQPLPKPILMEKSVNRTVLKHYSFLACTLDMKK
jgi:hypothetical protein